MKIVVIGGTGLIGSQLVKSLSKLGHEVIAASPSSGVNTITGEGLTASLEGAQVVVDVSNSPSFEPDAVMDFFSTSTQQLIAAEKTAGITHHITLSIVGIDRDGANAYFLAKLAQEKLIRESGIPYSILRATQFYEFVPTIAQAGGPAEEVHISPALFQPLASADVVAALVNLVIAPALNAIAEVAGPEKIGLDAMVRKYYALKDSGTSVVTDISAGYFGTAVDDQTLVPGNDPILGHYYYDQWAAIPGNLK
jgi:uncharacterized protein YbjT (DUF2867 family)